MTISVTIDGLTPDLKSNHIENIVKLKSGDSVDFRDTEGQHTVFVGQMTRIDKGPGNYELHISKANSKQHKQPTAQHAGKRTQKAADEFYFDPPGGREIITDAIAQNLMLATGKGETLTYKNVDYSISHKQLIIYDSVIWYVTATPV